MNTLEIDSWATPASSYPHTKRGVAKLSHFTYRPGHYEMYGVKGYNLAHCSRGIRVTNLKISGKVWMVDDPAHWNAMEEHAETYSGHVVCAGLGLGLIVHALSKNPRVTKITVVERCLDVIRLIRPLVPACEIIHADFWEAAIPEVDGVLYDLFVGDGRELLNEALRVRLELRRMYPAAEPIRIHGFNNGHLDQLDQFLEHL